MSRWALKVGNWKGVPIFVHATTPIGLLIYAGVSPSAWAAFAGVILLHELGHAAVVRAVGGRATEVMIHGFGGYCRWVGDVTPLGRAAIACGGVAAQLVLLFIALGLEKSGVVPWEMRLSEFWYRLTTGNAIIIALNLLPIAPLDGAEAWRFPLLLGERVRRAVTRERTRGPVSDEAAKALASRLLDDARRGDD
ncbi:MAG: metalloprotease [Archangium sp.]